MIDGSRDFDRGKVNPLRRGGQQVLDLVQKVIRVQNRGECLWPAGKGNDLFSFDHAHLGTRIGFGRELDQTHAWNFPVRWNGAPLSTRSARGEGQKSDSLHGKITGATRACHLTTAPRTAIPLDRLTGRLEGFPGDHHARADLYRRARRSDLSGSRHEFDLARTGLWPLGDSPSRGASQRGVSSRYRRDGREPGARCRNR